MKFTPSDLPDLSGKIFIVTGGNTGIGYYTVLHLAEHHAKVYLCARSAAKGNAAIESIREHVPGAKVELLEMDHLSLATVISAASTFLAREKQLHGLINNAGIMMTPISGTMTADDHEAEWQTNYLAHWVFTQHLIPTMLATSKSCSPGEVRIVNVSSNGHRYPPTGGINFDDPSLTGQQIMAHYGQNKLANILHAKTLNVKYGPNSVSAKAGDGEIWSAAIHPGVIQTQLFKGAVGFMPRAMLVIYKLLKGEQTPDEGSYQSLFAAASKDMNADQSGAYFEGLGKGGTESNFAKDPQLAEKLEQWTEKAMTEGGWARKE